MRERAGDATTLALSTSPLAEIEARVQARAKDLALDVRAGRGVEQLRALIDDEVAAWRADHRRGLRAFDLADPDGVADRAYRNLAGYGPLEPLLADPDVWEVMVSGPSTRKNGRRSRSAASSSDRHCPS